MKKISFVFIILILSLSSCQDSKKINPDVKAIEIELDIIRFDSIFAKAKPQDLKILQSNYPFMFQTEIPDSLWILKLKDTLQQEIHDEVLKAFPDFSKQEYDIKLFFQHLKYYFPDENIPKTITIAEYVDYKSKVILNDDKLFISLDNFLGKEHRFYAGFQDYISELQTKSQILPDIAEQLANKLIDFPDNRNFLNQMIYHGKKLYFKAQLLPLVENHEIIGYTKEDYEWAKQQEYMIWQYFVERDLLYSSQSDLRSRFLQPGPFSKFYLEIDNETPPRLGEYLGWQIIKAYAERHKEKSLQDIINTDAQELFNQSNYKP